MAERRKPSRLTPSSNRPNSSAPRTAASREATRPLPEVPEVVDPVWLLRVGLAVVAVAALCAYITLCVVFWKTQWQLVLHPSRSVGATPSAYSLPFQEVHFSPGQDGQPELDGWWIPVENPAAPVALLLHDGKGSIADALPLAQSLHAVRLQVLLFDYRGFGRSSGAHPTEATMEQDAAAALDFIRNGRHIPIGSIVPVSEGLGASLAVRLAAEHHDLPAIVLVAPDGDFAERVRLATRSRAVPFHRLFHERFPLADPLASLKTPKLMVSFGTGSPSVLARRAADPKTTVELPAADTAALRDSLHRFVGSYVMRAPAELVPEAKLPNAH